MVAYQRPPITEAVIDIHFAEAADQSTIEKVSKSYSSSYPREEVLKRIGVEFQFSVDGRGALPKPIEDGALRHRRASDDNSELLLLAGASFTVSQLAPYPGWEEFFGRFQRDWSKLKAAAGYRKISRIGVRYINRLDIPIKESVVTVSDFLKLFVEVPEDFGQLQAYGAQAQFALPDINCALTVNTGSVVPPLLEHFSVILDLDIVRAAELPQRDDEIFDMLEQIRKKKNEIFEASITDEARKVFSR